MLIIATVPPVVPRGCEERAVQLVQNHWLDAEWCRQCMHYLLSLYKCDETSGIQVRWADRIARCRRDHYVQLCSLGCQLPDGALGLLFDPHPSPLHLGRNYCLVLHFF